MNARSRTGFGRRGPRLVWTLAGIGAASALLTVAGLSWALQRGTALRESVTRVESISEPLMLELERTEGLQIGVIARVLAKDDAAVVVAGSAAAAARPESLRLLTGRLKSHGMDISDTALNIMTQINALDAYERSAVAWSVRDRQREAQATAAHDEVVLAIEGMTGAASTAQGRSRLERLKKIRALDQADAQTQRAIAMDIISEGDQNAELSSIYRELSEIRLLVERLDDCASIDQLASMRDNRFTPSLMRLRTVVGQRAAGGRTLEAIPAEAVTSLAQMLFGPGYTFESSQLGSGQDGFYGLHLERCRLEIEGERIRNQAFLAMSASRQARRELRTRCEEVVVRLQAEARDAMATAWLLAISTGLGSVVGLLTIGWVVARSIRRQALELEASEVAATSASVAKSEFLANMSHEIRTPLTAIIGYADVLREDKEVSSSEEKRGQVVETIRIAGLHLLTVINDILDLSKIEAGKMRVEAVETDIPALLTEVESLMRPRAAGKGVRLDVRPRTEVPSIALTDPTRLRQILMNTIGNAVKFTQDGSVEVHVAWEDKGVQGGVLTFEVEDTGAGMTPEQASRLFQVFSQADASTTRKFGGTGLGLVICRRLARLMGGDVLLARSEPGKGSCFRVSIATSAAAGATMTRELSRVLKRADRGGGTGVSLNGRILLAEDGPDNQRLISFHLRKAGATVDVADNGQIALEMIERAIATGHPYDLLVSDMQMPEMDGYTLATTLRGRGIGVEALPIVALTAHAMQGDREKCLNAGCDDYAVKPIDKIRLLRTCDQWMLRRGARKAA